MKYYVAHQTDIGRRSGNQDSLCLKEAATRNGNVIMAVACDGMGGLSKGEVASATVVCLFSRWFENNLENILKDIPSSEEELLRVRNEWNDIILDVNKQIAEYGKTNGSVKLGTTVTAMLILQDGNYIICNVGDTRAYRITEKSADRITEDQTVVEQEVKEGRMTAEQAEKDKRRNVLLQCIGASEELEPDYIIGKSSVGEAYLLCTDGFRHNVTLSEMHEELVPHSLISEDEMRRKLEKLSELNKKRGETDNITSLLIKIL